MNRFKIICIGIALIIITIIMSSCVPTEHDASGYKIERLYKHSGSSMRIYKVKTPDKTYIILRDGNGGMQLLN